MLLAGALLPWIRISVDVPFVGEITATPAGTQGMGTYTMIGGALSLALAIFALVVRAAAVTHRESTAAERARAILRWSGLAYTLIAAVLLVLSLLGLMRYYQSANRDVFLGIRLIDLFDFAVDWLDLKLNPQIGLILTGIGMGLLLAGALTRLVVGLLIEKPIIVVGRKRELLKLVLMQDTQPNLEFAIADGVTLGRGEDNHIVIQDDLASRHHAEIRWRDGGYVVNDRGSTNGVLVNGQRIAGPHRVSPGDRIQIGRAVFAVYGETRSDSGVPLSADGYRRGKRGTGPSQSPDQRLLWSLAALGGLLFLVVVGGAVLLLSRDREQGLSVDTNLFQEMATAIPADLLEGDESIISPLAIPTISFPVLEPTTEPEPETSEAIMPKAALPRASASLSMELPISLPDIAIATVEVLSQFP